MIKFNCLIHKKTDTVIKYEDWLEMHYSHSTIELTKRCYDSDRMLFGNDFEIIYDSEFTTEELTALDDCIAVMISEDIGYRDLTLEYNLRNKIADIVKDKISLKDKYGIEGIQ